MPQGNKEDYTGKQKRKAEYKEKTSKVEAVRKNLWA
jgi:hypothetical protein